jgi:glycosyltransferase involved in cell wall biosynthesis
MKVLLSAVACDPYRGSEAHFGWTALKAIASRHDVWVLGHAKDAEAIELARAEGLIGGNVHFYPHSEWGGRHANRILARVQNWRDYQNWTRMVLETGRKLEKEIGFDVVHHVTLSTWRVPSELWRLGKPFVWGPVGGAEVFPLKLLPGAGLVPAIYELARRWQNAWAFRSVALKQCIQNSAWIFASSPETHRLLLRAGCSEDKIGLLSAAFFSSAQMEWFGNNQSRELPGDSRFLRLFAGGDLEARKGFYIALKALSEIGRQGMDFSYHIAGCGPEEGRLRLLARKLGIEDKVRITGPLAGDDYRRKLWETDVYLLPSLRDSAGLTLMEAMLAGCVPVVANCGGPGMIVTDASGFRVVVSSEGTMVDQIVRALMQIAGNREGVAVKCESARRRIAEDFCEAAYLKSMEAAYTKVVS